MAIYQQGLSGEPAPLSPTIPQQFGTSEFMDWSTQLALDNRRKQLALINPIPGIYTPQQVNRTVDENFIEEASKVATSNSSGGGTSGDNPNKFSKLNSFYNKYGVALNSGLNLANSVIKQPTNKGDQIANTVLNSVGDVVSSIPGWGWVAGGALKGISFLNSALGSTVKGNRSNELFDISSSYTGVDKKEDKKFGLFGTIFGGKSKYRDEVAKTQGFIDNATDILNNANELKLASNSASSNFANNYLNQLRGGYSQKVYAGKQGLKFDLDFVHKVLNQVPQFKSGGKLEGKNVIPEGALHAHKHNIYDPDLEGNITKKGIPVVKREGTSVDQIAEIERNEVIFSLEVTNKLEKLRDDGSDEAAIKAGELLVYELLHNTVDNTGLIKSVN